MKILILKILTVVLYLSFYVGVIAMLGTIEQLVPNYLQLRPTIFIPLTTAIPLTIIIIFNLIWRSYSKTKLSLEDKGPFKLNRISILLGIILSFILNYFLGDINVNYEQTAYFIFILFISLYATKKRKKIKMDYFERFSFTISACFTMLKSVILSSIILWIIYRTDFNNLSFNAVSNSISLSLKSNLVHYIQLLLFASLLAPLFSIYSPKNTTPNDDLLLDDWDMS